MAFNADVCVTLPGSFLALAEKAIVPYARASKTHRSTQTRQ